MNILTLLNEKTIKAKEKTETIAQWLLDKKISERELIETAAGVKDPVKATCIEAIEFATKTQPDVISKEGFEFITQNLTAKAPRVKWESAKVIANTAHLFPSLVADVIPSLLKNTTDNGTVVRWSAATGLATILSMKSKHNHTLIPLVEQIAATETQKSIVKIYTAALKKAAK